MSNPNPAPDAESSPLLGLGEAWTRVGYGILVLAVTAFILIQVVHPVLLVPAKAAIPEGYRAFKKDTDVQILLKASPLAMVSVFTLIFSGVFGFVWTLVDLIDRRQRMVWLLPMLLCVLLQALHAVPLALYLFMGRATRKASSNVR